MWRLATPVAWVLLAVVLLTGGACSDSDDAAPSSPSPPSTAGSSTDPLTLPPGNVAELAPIIDPLVAPLGLRLARASLVAQGAPDARHLALYVEPLTAFSDEQFVQTILPLAASVTPFVFQRWPGLESYDICQEPSPGVDDGPAPAPITVLVVSREYSLATDWDRVALPALVTDSLNKRPGIVVGTTSRLQPVLQAAVAQG